MPRFFEELPKAGVLLEGLNGMNGREREQGLDDDDD